MTDPRRIQQLWATTLRATSFEGIKLDATVKPGSLPLDQARTAPLARGAGGTILEQSPAASAELTVPAEIQRGLGHYKLLSIVGQGGMGVIYRAQQSGLDRPVAVKKIRRKRDERIEADFLRESRITGRLDHPNVVPVFDLGSDQQREPMLAMKLVDGIAWSELLHPKQEALKLRAEKMGLVGQLGILLKVCDAVAFAHSKGIVHCDLKPENVMLGEYGEVFVMDWGVAVEIGQAIDKPGPRGTPVYMAPELVDGQAEAIGKHTDVYLLGAILYEIVAGKPPHDRPSLMEVLMAAIRSEPAVPQDASPELVALIRGAMAPHPSRRFTSVKGFQAALEAYLSHRESLTISRRAQVTLRDCQELAARGPLRGRERVDLYEGFAEAVAGFRQAQLLWPGNAEADSGEQEARKRYAETALASGDLGLAEAQVAKLERDALRKPLEKELRRRRRARNASDRRRRILGYGLGASLSALVIGLGFGLSYYVQTNKTLESKQRETERQKGIVERQKTDLERQRAATRRRAEDLDRAFRFLLVRIREDLAAVSNSEVRELRGKILEDAMATLEAIQQQSDASAGEAALEIYTVSALRQLAELAYEAGQARKGRAYAERALSLARALVKREPRSAARFELADALTVLARILELENDFEAASERIKEAISELEAVSEAPVQEQRIERLARARQRLGLLYAELDRVPEAIAQLRTSVEVLAPLIEDDESPTRLLRLQRDSIRLLGDTEARAEEFLKGFKRLKEAMALNLRVRGRGPLRSADLRAMAAIAESQGKLGQRMKMDSGIAAYQIAYTARKRLAARDPENGADQIALSNIAKILSEIATASGDTLGALEYAREAVGISGELSAQNPDNILYRKSYLDQLVATARIHTARGENPRALEIYQTAQEQTRDLIGRFPKDRQLRFQAAEIYAFRGALSATENPARAEGFYQQSLQMVQALKAEDPENKRYQETERLLSGQLEVVRGSRR